nr:hypothetical protein [uncultured Rhodopila sp.]
MRGADAVRNRIVPQVAGGGKGQLMDAPRYSLLAPRRISSSRDQSGQRRRPSTCPVGARLTKLPSKPDSTYSCSFVFIRVSIALSQLAPPVTGKQIRKHE